MKTRIVEVTNGHRNWGKFMLGVFDLDDLGAKSQVGLDVSIITQRGWCPSLHFLMLDLETGEGAIFRHGGYAVNDLLKHQVWVCPLFEPFLAHVYHQPFSYITNGPALVDLPDAPFEMHGYRRQGPNA